MTESPKRVSIEELKKRAMDKKACTEEEFDKLIDGLKRTGDIFEPKKGFLQMI